VTSLLKYFCAAYGEQKMDQEFRGFRRGNRTIVPVARSALLEDRFGSESDIRRCPLNVWFTPRKRTLLGDL
jgi:hypothetical protein